MPLTSADKVWIFTARYAQDRKEAQRKDFSFAADNTANENLDAFGKFRLRFIGS